MARHKKIITAIPECLSNSIRRALYFMAVPVLAVPFASAEEQFNTSFIRGEYSTAISHALASGDEILPGDYPLNIYLNGQRIDAQTLTFKKDTPHSPGYFCLTAQDYQTYGVLLPTTTGSSACYDLVKNIPGSQISWDMSVQRMTITIPQASMTPRPRGTISPLLFDRGINAAFVNYSWSGNHNRYSSSGSVKNSDYYFLSLNNGINMGDWRLRNNASLSRQSGESARWTPIATWAERDITSWRSRLLMGQSYTNNNVFDSIQFRGIQVSSIPEMLPDSQRGYAPVVRGVANTNARVEVRQNGYTVYSTVVPPGPFALNDIYPSSSSGDLDVTVFEADGTRHNFNVAYSSVPNMLREGILEYQVTAGKYHDGTTHYEPHFIQGSLSYGTEYDLTPYGGVLVAEHYRAGVFGIGKNMGRFGATSVDASWSDTDLASGGSKTGASIRFLYSKSLNELGTQFQLAGYRYSTSGYYDFSDAVAERDTWQNGFYQTTYYDYGDDNGQPDWATESQRRRYHNSLRFNNKRQRIDISVNQRVFGASLFANFTRQNYWNTSGYDRTVQTGINTVINQINYSLFYQNSRSPYGYSDDSINAGISIPFSMFSPNSLARATFNATHSRQNGDGFNAGINGSLLDDNRLNYGVQSGHTQHGGDTSTANLNYQGSVGNLGLGYSYNNNYQQSSLNASGGVVLHSGGVTLSQPLQSTFVLVNADGAKGVRLENQPGVAIDRFGYAVLPYAQAYRHNRVALRTSDIGNGLDIPLASQDIVPTQRAIGKVVFETHLGHSLLIHTTLADGSTPAIGATIFGTRGASIGVVGNRGEAYVSGVTSGERLQIKWGDDEHDACVMTVPELPALDPNQPGGYQVISLTCSRA